MACLLSTVTELSATQQQMSYMGLGKIVCADSAQNYTYLCFLQCPLMPIKTSLQSKRWLCQVPRHCLPISGIALLCM